MQLILRTKVLGQALSIGAELKANVLRRLSWNARDTIVNFKDSDTVAGLLREKRARARGGGADTTLSSYLGIEIAPDASSVTLAALQGSSLSGVLRAAKGIEVVVVTAMGAKVATSSMVRTRSHDVRGFIELAYNW